MNLRGIWQNVYERYFRPRDFAYRKALEVASREIAKHIAKRNPPKNRPKRGVASRYWTPKQFRWWWGTMHRKALGESKELAGWTAQYVMRDGRKRLEIKGGYIRTGELMDSFTYSPQKSKDGVWSLVVENTKSYAPFVMGTPPAPVHRNRWIPLRQILLESQRRFSKTFAVELKRRLK